MTGSDNKAPLITLFGGSGFLGRSVIDALSQRGWRIRVASRDFKKLAALDLATIVDYLPTDITNSDSVAKALEGADAVVNLVGILSPSRTHSFDGVHHLGTAKIAEAAHRAGIVNFVQISAIGADANSQSSYARSKALGEQAVLKLIPTAIILRPSIIFGAHDSFFNRFAEMARFSPFLPLIGGGKTLFEPVFVEDVALAVAESLGVKAHSGTIYELGGGTTYSFAYLLRYLGRVTSKRRLLIPIPFALAKWVGLSIETIAKLSGQFFPQTFLITEDQVTSLRTDNIVSEKAKAENRTLSGLGITPQSIEAIVPTYLG